MLEREICWNITTKCNQNCKYCHRFLNIDDLNFIQNKQILENLINENVNSITWTGGEALLYPNIMELLKIAKENGIKNKLITNGILLNKDKITELSNYLDDITLSIDSVDNDINNRLGRGKNHYNNIKEILNYLNDKNIDVTINTVITKENINNIEELGIFLKKYNIKNWRIFKFMPLRETAQINKLNFEVTNEQFEETKNVFKKFENNFNIEFRTEEDMENKYILLVANGDIIKTESKQDIIKGNALYNNLMDFIK